MQKKCFYCFSIFERRCCQGGRNFNQHRVSPDFSQVTPSKDLKFRDGPYDPQSSLPADSTEASFSPSGLARLRQMCPSRSNSSLCAFNAAPGKMVNIPMLLSHWNMGIKGARHFFPGFWLSISGFPWEMRLKPLLLDSTNLCRFLSPLHGLVARYSLYTIISTLSLLLPHCSSPSSLFSLASSNTCVGVPECVCTHV